MFKLGGGWTTWRETHQLTTSGSFARVHDAIQYIDTFTSHTLFSLYFVFFILSFFLIFVFKCGINVAQDPPTASNKCTLYFNKNVVGRESDMLSSRGCEWLRNRILAHFPLTISLMNNQGRLRLNLLRMSDESRGNRFVLTSKLSSFSSRNFFSLDSDSADSCERNAADQ